MIADQALIAAGAKDSSIDRLLEFLEPRRLAGGSHEWSEAELRSFRAHGIKPPARR